MFVELLGLDGLFGGIGSLSKELPGLDGLFGGIGPLSEELPGLNGLFGGIGSLSEELPGLNTGYSAVAEFLIPSEEIKKNGDARTYRPCATILIKLVTRIRNLLRFSPLS
ncbi:hypothetical protein [Cohnella lupini]|uniref:Uncharacterized protein n=1 Tax=Cohnella lupini TaxID=1294267 RepID=A0A3D9IX51_9BACL|nr:hypothetical protein [Cohnella lupini]RED66295.1 hypothetical protein DFP95_101794 [Cohnella lupini]